MSLQNEIRLIYLFFYGQMVRVHTSLVLSFLQRTGKEHNWPGASQMPFLSVSEESGDSQSSCQVRYETITRVRAALGKPQEGQR